MLWPLPKGLEGLFGGYEGAARSRKESFDPSNYQAKELRMLSLID